VQSAVGPHPATAVVPLARCGGRGEDSGTLRPSQWRGVEGAGL